MSYFSKVFGNNDKKKPEIPTVSSAMDKLRNIEELLVKKQEYLEKKIENEVVLIKKYGKDNKRAALQALKRKKRYEQQLRQLDGTLATVEMQRESLEGASANSSILQAMKAAADAMKSSQKNMDADQVHEILDDIAEQQEISQEISQAISSPIGLTPEYDEEELERELEELEQEELDKELISIGVAPPLPSVPCSSVEQPAKNEITEEEEADLKKLEQWLA